MTAEPVDIALDLLANLRDLGGLDTEAGGHTRSGVLLRSAAPQPGDRHPGLSSWPPATVLDLRGPGELAGRPHPLAAAGAVVHALPLLDREVHAGPNGTDWSKIPDLGTAYLGFLVSGGRSWPAWWSWSPTRTARCWCTARRARTAPGW